jgi:hypothetical protein
MHSQTLRISMQHRQANRTPEPPSLSTSRLPLATVAPMLVACWPAAQAATFQSLCLCTCWTRMRSHSGRRIHKTLQAHRHKDDASCICTGRNCSQVPPDLIQSTCAGHIRPYSCVDPPEKVLQREQVPRLRVSKLNGKKGPGCCGGLRQTHAACFTWRTLQATARPGEMQQDVHTT